MLFAPTLLSLALGLLQTAGQGAVATSQVDATEVGLEILAQGGNAIDAAIAVHFALAVTYPYAGNIGGGGFLLYRDAEGEAWFLDFRETAPAAATSDLYLDDDGRPIAEASQVGWKAVGVPGAVPGMWDAHQRWGRLPWSDLLKPAEELARGGYRIGVREASRLKNYGQAMREDVIAREIFFPQGRALQVDDLFQQPKLAETIGLIREQGVSVMQHGDLVDDIVRASEAGGGILQSEDFANYRPALREVWSFAWDGREVLAAPLPSSGGIFLQQVLFTLEGTPFEVWGFDDPRSIQFLGEATSAAFRDRNAWLGDPASLDFDPLDLVDTEYLRSRRRSLGSSTYTPPSRSLPSPPMEHFETTHFSVVDGDGAAVSCTTTLNGAYGAKVMAPGGFVMNNEMDDFAALPGTANQYGLVQSKYNAVVAGRRPLSSMCPVIVVENGKVDAVVGSPGGPTILTSVLQVLLARYSYHMSPEASMAAPRFHRQDLPPQVQYETERLNSAQKEALRSFGQPLRLRKRLGDVNAIFRTKSGWEAIADPRYSGSAGEVQNSVSSETGIPQ
ncbi:MAG: gamma-glutamyltransferase [Planctomycetota bacterium]|nr:MAG: gamma-glutamyltransferase [Planctomycetota bacterium]